MSELLSTLRGAPGGQAGATEPGIPFADFRRFFLLLPRTEMLVDYWLRASCPSACDIGARVLMRDDTAPAKVGGWHVEYCASGDRCLRLPAALLQVSATPARAQRATVERNGERFIWLHACKQFCPPHKRTRVVCSDTAWICGAPQFRW